MFAQLQLDGIYRGGKWSIAIDRASIDESTLKKDAFLMNLLKLGFAGKYFDVEINLRRNVLDRCRVETGR
jgi:hypothetical protein